MLGFRVRMREAEYPDQKPCSPFSSRMEAAISDTVGSTALEPVRAEAMAAVCLRVTMLEIGVVKNFEQAPARAPIANSSNIGKVVVLFPCFCSRLVLK